VLEFLPNARAFADTCMQIKPGEEILILADDTARERMYGEVMRDVINDMGAEAVLMIMTKRVARVHEPPKSATAAMLSADKIIRLTTMGMGHTNARVAATEKGIPYHNMQNLPEVVFAEPYPVELIEKAIVRTEKIAKLLGEGKEVKVTTPAGTNLTVGIAGRAGMPLHARSAGIASCTFTGGGEALVPPVEDGANGVMVVDVHTNPTTGLLSIPLTWKVVDGKVVEITGGTDAEREREKHLMSLDEGANKIAEFAINTNRPVSKAIDSEEGMVHIAFGRNDDLGGVTYSKNHLDGYMRNPTVEIDGVRVLENGRFLID
jgi:leucyl aminopeptidase (aminopeptidase T)